MDFLGKLGRHHASHNRLILDPADFDANGSGLAEDIAQHEAVRIVSVGDHLGDQTKTRAQAVLRLRPRPIKLSSSIP